MAKTSQFSASQTLVRVDMVDPLSVDGPPASIGKYQILGPLGRGACGIVYHGRDPFVDRDVAIKVAHNTLGAPGAADSDLEREFFVEARAAGRLQHPGIVAVFDAGSEKDMNYIVMEFVEGQTLGELGATEPTPERVVEIAFDCAKALDYAHRANVLHRDIKPDNIMVRKDGMTKLMDFSIAAVMQNRQFTQDVILGTPSYMAPEQIRGASIGPATDLYSLGAVIYRLLTGHPPHRATNRKALLQLIVNTPCQPLDEIRPDLPAPLCAIVNQLLAREPADRFQSGHELAMALLKVYDRRTVNLQRTPHSAERMALASLEFCRDMVPLEVDELLAAGRIRRVEAGETILRAGMEDEALHLIVLGEFVEMGGTPVIFGQSEVFGSLGLPGSQPVPNDVLARSDGLLLEVPRASLEACSEACRVRVYQACCAVLRYRVALISALSG